MTEAFLARSIAHELVGHVTPPVRRMLHKNPHVPKFDSDSALGVASLLVVLLVQRDFP